MLCGIATLSAQPVFTVDNVSGNTGQTVAVDITVDDFENLISIRYGLLYDPAIIEFVSIENQTPDVSWLQVFTPDNGFPEGIIRVLAADQSDPSTVPDGDVFFTINFRIVGAAGTSTDVSLDEDWGQEAVEVINGEDTDIGMSLVAGSVRVLGGGAPDPTLRLGSATAMSGDQICLPMRVTDFADVKGLEYDITWDPTLLQFVEIRNLNLTELDPSDFNTTDASAGQIRKAWITSVPDGVSLPNNTAIYELCYNVIGSSGNTANISISNVVSDPTIITRNGQVNIQGGVEGLAFIIDNAIQPFGDRQCVDVSVNDFVNITAFQYTHAFNTDDATFIEVTNRLPALGNNFLSGNPEPNEVTVAWVDPAGQTFPNGTVLYTVCFNSDLDCDDSFPVTFIPDGTTSTLIVDVNGQLDPSEFTLVDGGVTITCGASLTIDQIINVDCFGASTGAIFSTVTPPGDYSFTLNDQPSVEDPNNLPAGRYTFTVTDNTDPNNSATQIIDITQPDAIVINGTVVDADPDMDNGAINNVSVTGGVEPYSCVWDRVLTDCAGGNNLACGEYTVTVTDGNNCVERRTFNIGCGITDLNFPPATVMDNTCNEADSDACDGTIIAEATGEGPLTYTINGAAFDGTATDLCAGEYVLIVTDAGNGNATASQTVTINEPDPIEILVDKMDQSAAGVNDGRIEVTGVIGGTPPYNVSINGVDTMLLDSLMPNTYLVEVTDGAGCQKIQMEQITGVDDPTCFQGRPAITPNGDLQNDFLTISCVQFNQNELRIFNRWGQLVFVQENYDNTWSGQDFGNTDLPEDVYFWLLSVDLPDGAVREITGYVNLIRDLK